MVLSFRDCEPFEGRKHVLSLKVLIFKQQILAPVRQKNSLLKEYIEYLLGLMEGWNTRHGKIFLGTKLQILHWNWSKEETMEEHQSIPVLLPL